MSGIERNGNPYYYSSYGSDDPFEIIKDLYEKVPDTYDIPTDFDIQAVVNDHSIPTEVPNPPESPEFYTNHIYTYPAFDPNLLYLTIPYPQNPMPPELPSNQNSLLISPQPTEPIPVSDMSPVNDHGMFKRGLNEKLRGIFAKIKSNCDENNFDPVLIRTWIMAAINTLNLLHQTGDNGVPFKPPYITPAASPPHEFIFNIIGAAEDILPFLDNPLPAGSSNFDMGYVILCMLKFAASSLELVNTPAAMPGPTPRPPQGTPISPQGTPISFQGAPISPQGTPASVSLESAAKSSKRTRSKTDKKVVEQAKGGFVIDLITYEDIQCLKNSGKKKVTRTKFSKAPIK